MAAGTVKAPKKAAPKSAVPKEWRDLLRLIPGYDPFDQADGCWFEPEAAQLYIDFIEECVQHVEGDMRGKPFILQPWQKAIVANLFGWKKKDEFGRTVRRYQEAFIMVARKNGKTPLIAAIALAVFTLDPEAGQQNYVAAESRGQAGKLFRQLKGMVDLSPEMKAAYRDYGGTAQAGQAKSIVKRNEETSFIQVISADASAEHGGNTHLAIIDELHTQPSRDLVDVLSTSVSSANRKQPLRVYITTAGHDRFSVCFEKYTEACRVRDNGGDELKPGYNPGFLPVIYETTEDDDWTDEAAWYKANPNLGVSKRLDYMRAECKRAQEIPDYENTFRQLDLDQWTKQARKWLPMNRWDECGKAGVDREALAGRACRGALDMASTSDLTALVLEFKNDDGTFDALSFFWLPEAAVEKRSNQPGVNYDVWVKHGLIKTNEGDWLDYTYVFEDIKALADEFNILELAYDPREASMLAQMLKESGVEVVPFIQSFANYNEPVKVFEQLVSEGRFHHGGNPVLAWNAGNVALAEHNGLRLPSKLKSGEKIDGISSAIMALALWMRSPDEGGWFKPGMWSK
jgi:phage terminase large subunit-like protein